MTGQDAVNSAKAFHDRLSFWGAVLTKMDGDTRGGAALSIRAITNASIKFLSVGEALTNLNRFILIESRAEFLAEAISGLQRTRSGDV